MALAVDAFGGLDVLVNNAGYGMFGAIEEAEPDEYRPMFEVNVFGLIAVTRAALAALRQRPGGRIVNLSSIAGNNDGKQAGDPAKAVDVILRAVDSVAPPLHLPLGPVAHAVADRKLASFREEIDAWRQLASATDFN